MSSSNIRLEQDNNYNPGEGQPSRLNQAGPETPAIQSLKTASVNSASTPPPPADGEKQSNTQVKSTFTSRFSEKIKSKLPSYDQFKKAMKADIGLTVALILVLANKTHMVIGQGILLSCIAMIFFCPVKPVGQQLEVVIISLLGVMLSAAWCFLGMFLANLSRDPTVQNPFQASSGVILAVFLFIGTFFNNWLRSVYPQANFAGILGSIVIIFAMTTADMYPIFSPTIVWAFVIPIAIGAGIAIVVDIVIWPEDSANNCLAMFSSTFDTFNQLLTQQSEVFLRDPELALPEQATSLSAIHTQLQGKILTLIESKRALQREILYSKLTQKDFSYLTKLVKSMRIPLQGIGLSRVIEQEMYDAQSGGTLMKWQTATLQIYSPEDIDVNQRSAYGNGGSPSVQSDQLIDEYKETLQLLRPICNSLATECTSTLKECMRRLNCLHNGDKSKKNLDRNASSQTEEKGSNDAGNGETTPLEATPQFSERLKSSLETFEKQRTRNLELLYQGKLTERDPHRAMLLLLTFQYNLREYAEKILEMSQFVESLEQDRDKRRMRWPKITLKNWMNGNVRDDDITANGNQNQIGDGDGSGGLTRTVTRINNNDTSVDGTLGPSAWEVDNHGNSVLRDPDVLAPHTRWERLFYKLYQVKRWLFEPNTLTVLKTSIGCVLLSLPAFFSASATWYSEWRGQWATITLVFWMFPHSGMLIFGFFMRLLGTVIGCVIGIVVWEICQGNPYALAVVMFVLNYWMYHLFFYKPFYRFATLMAQITTILVVCYTYNYILYNTPQPAYEVSGKRCLLVVIGVVAASIMYCIPFPITGRVELRYRLAHTVRDIGVLYSSLIYIFETMAPDRPVTEAQRKKFQKLALDIQRQIALERTLLAHAKYEPPLRGKYPEDKYKLIVDHVDNMADMIYAMGSSIEKLSPIWRANLTKKAMSARKTYVATIMTAFKLVSAALAAKTSLPPYLHYPKDALSEFGDKIRQLPESESSYLDDPAFTVFAAYFLNSGSFVLELQALLEIIRDLVGVDSPGHWMQIA